jgi:hypothetical protein
MSKHFAAVALALGLLAAAGWALAQQGQPQGPGPNTPAGVKPPPANDLPVVLAPGQRGLPPGLAAPAAPGRFAVVRLDKGAVLVDTATGRTWDLERGADGRAAWLPARWLVSEKDAEQWRQQEKARGAAAQDRVRELEAELERVRYAARIREAQRRQRDRQRAKDKEDQQ